MSGEGTEVSRDGSGEGDQGGRCSGVLALSVSSVTRARRGRHQGSLSRRSNISRLPSSYRGYRTKLCGYCVPTVDFEFKNLETKFVRFFAVTAWLPR
uniref:Uncharacterized protein n=1 Tax=Oryza sativa subsp. japonica TaxID=39947 RepID=Q2QZY1_ORYSJ|nr:hypothetical protein LOC_Os11g44450 [Oryza sativa Japonica Group]